MSVKARGTNRYHLPIKIQWFIVK